MAQVVQHNITALNSYNKLSTNNSALSKNLEKLSSGYKINRAADDAAGLAISEKMRAQITGLERAATNAQDGISLVQTAEGALTEVHSMLNRMVELATQSANGTYEDNVDRENLQAEVDALLEEIDRISSETNFNGINLLDGTVGAGAKVTTTDGTDATGGSKAVITIDLSSTKVTKTKQLVIGDQTLTSETATSATAVSYTDIKTNLSGKTITINGEAYTGSIDTTTGLLTLTAKSNGETALTDTTVLGAVTASTKPTTATIVEQGENSTVAGTAAKLELDFTGKKGSDAIGSTITIDGTTYEFVKTGGTASGSNTAIEVDEDATASDLADAFLEAAGIDLATSTTYTDGNSNDYTIAQNGAKITFTCDDAGELGDDILELSVKGKGLGLQIGDTASQRISVQLKDMSTTALGINGLKIDTESAATDAIDTIKTAINLVSRNRADLGAVQNRLEHTITNLETTTENLTNAESAIRDTDMAKEMMAYTQNNVLSQAAQAMLAQANQQPQQVLQLLQ